MHVAATTDETIAGFIVVTDPPARTAANLPGIVRAMLGLAETAEMTGKPIAARSYAFRGPVCIDENFRGRGIYSGFNTATQKAYRDRYELGVVFVAEPRSRHTTTTKLGARSLAVFEVDSERYHFLAFEFRDRVDP